MEKPSKPRAKAIATSQPVISMYQIVSGAMILAVRSDVTNAFIAAEKYVAAGYVCSVYLVQITPEHARLIEESEARRGILSTVPAPPLDRIDPDNEPS